MKSLEKLLKTNKPKEQWTITEVLAEKEGYHKLEDRIYNKNNDYMTRMGNDLYFFENLDKQEYDMVKPIIKYQAKNQVWILIGYAMSMGTGSLGGAAVGFLLLQAGFAPWTMLPAILLPVFTSLAGIYTHSVHATKK